MMKKIPALAIAAMGLMLSQGAWAGFMLEGSEFTNGESAQTFFKEGGANEITAMASAPSGPVRTFQKKTVAGFTGVGISAGRTNGEIDWIGPDDESEALKFSFEFARRIADVTLGVLFDGPEFNDFQEVAQIRINEGLANDLTGTLTATFTNAAGLTASLGGALAGATVTNLSPATGDAGGVWKITDLFPGINVKTIEFTALKGICGDGACTNQSDYTFVKLTAVSEPAAIGLLGLGLLGIGFVRRR